MHKPTKNSVWLACKITRQFGDSSFVGCPVQYVAWANFKYSTEQLSEGAFTGALIDSRSGVELYWCEGTLTELLKSPRLFVGKFRGYSEQVISGI